MIHPATRLCDGHGSSGKLPPAYRGLPTGLPVPNANLTEDVQSVVLVVSNVGVPLRLW